MDANEAIKRWDVNALEYAEGMGEFGDHNKEHVLNPVLFELIGEVDGLDVLDAGCGEGYVSRALAKNGARVVAVDYSKELLTIARTRTPDDADITYTHANVESLDGVADQAFDMVVSSMVLMDLPDYVSALGEMRRVLKDDGRIVLVIAHPCFTSEGIWHRDESGKKLFWRIDNYFHETARPQYPTLKVEGEMHYFHRTLTSYFKAFKTAGLSVDRLVEPHPSDEVIAKIPNFANDLRMSHFIVFELSKQR